MINRNSATVPNPFAGLLPGTNLNGSTVSFTQLVQPYPQFTGVTMQATNASSSYFHALQVRLEKRFSHGLQFLANYQFGRTIARDNLLNAFGPIEKRPADIDRPHRFVTSFSYELPFGRGKPSWARSPVSAAPCSTASSAAGYQRHLLLRERRTGGQAGAT